MASLKNLDVYYSVRHAFFCFGFVALVPELGFDFSSPCQSALQRSTWSVTLRVRNESQRRMSTG